MYIILFNVGNPIHVQNTISDAGLNLKQNNKNLLLK